MQNTAIDVMVALGSSILGGLGATVLSAQKEKKAEKVRQEENAKNELRMELKDLQIKLYSLEKDLNEWKDKYYSAIQELIKVKAELEHSLINLNHLKTHNE